MKTKKKQQQKTTGNCGQVIYFCLFFFCTFCFSPSISFHPPAPSPTFLLPLIAFMFCLSVPPVRFPSPASPPRVALHQPVSALPSALSALLRRICQPLWLFLSLSSRFLPPTPQPTPHPASRDPPAWSWMCFDTLPAHNQTARQQLVFLVRLCAPLAPPHAPPLQGRARRSVARKSSKHLLCDMLMCKTSRPPSGLHVRSLTQRLWQLLSCVEPKWHYCVFFYTSTRPTTFILFYIWFICDLHRANDANISLDGEKVKRNVQVRL